MGQRRKYQDLELDEPILDTPEHVLQLGGARRYDPDLGGGAESGISLSTLTDLASGDWSYKPDRAPTDTLTVAPHLRYCARCDSHYCICSP